MTRAKTAYPKQKSHFPTHTRTHSTLDSPISATPNIPITHISTKGRGRPRKNKAKAQPPDSDDEYRPKGHASTTAAPTRVVPTIPSDRTPSRGGRPPVTPRSSRLSMSTRSSGRLQSGVESTSRLRSSMRSPAKVKPKLNSTSSLTWRASPCRVNSEEEEAQKLWKAFIDRLREVYRRQPDWAKVSDGVKKQLEQLLAAVVAARDLEGLSV